RGPRALRRAEHDPGQGGGRVARLRGRPGPAAAHAGHARGPRRAPRRAAGRRDPAGPLTRMATRIVVSGATGRMGRAVAALAAEAGDVELVGGIGREAGALPGAYERIAPPEDAAELISGCDVVVDFSAPEFL